MKKLELTIEHCNDCPYGALLADGSKVAVVCDHPDAGETFQDVKGQDWEQIVRTGINADTDNEVLDMDWKIPKFCPLKTVRKKAEK